LEENGDGLIKVSLKGLIKTTKNLSQDSLCPGQESWESCQYSNRPWDGWPGSIPGTGKIFPFSTVSRIALGSTYHPIRWETRAIYLVVKQLGCEADHSLPYSAEVSGGAIFSLPHVFMPYCLTN
jgi:hypothetical protein